MQIPAEDLDATLKRLQRARGQLDAVVRMIKEERDCKEIITQLAACSKALDRAGFSLITTGMQRCLDVDHEEREQNLATMEKLFLSLS